MTALCLALCASCAAKQQSRTAALLPGIATLERATLLFGHPSKSTPEADGGIRHEWLLDTTHEVAGRWVTELSPWVRHDSDGYRVEEYREVWKPAHTVTKFCRITVVSDAEGRVLRSAWEGKDCDDLLVRDPLVR